MTAKIIQFKSKTPFAPAKEDQPEVVKSNRDIYTDVIDDVMGEWQTAARNNRLSEFIASRIPSHARGPKNADYVNDLNVLSNVEQKLGILPAIFAPGCTPTNQIGWFVAFHKGKEIFSTPPDMVSEGMARALNVVLFATYQNTLKTLGRL